MPRAASAGCVPEDTHAGTPANNSPVRIEVPKANANTIHEGSAETGILCESGNANASIVRDPK